MKLMKAELSDDLDMKVVVHGVRARRSLYAGFRAAGGYLRDHHWVSSHCTHGSNLDSKGIAQWQSPPALMKCDIDLMPVNTGEEINATGRDSGRELR